MTKITVDKETIEQAAESLERIDAWFKARHFVGLVPHEVSTVEALRAALAEPSVEPVAEMCAKRGRPVLMNSAPMLADKQLLYTSPPPHAEPVVELAPGENAASHPMQPVVMVGKVARFQKNAMVDHLYNWAVERGMGMNEMAALDFSPEDRMQFAQLIGYSVSGYGNLSYVTDASYEQAMRQSAGLK